MTYVSNFTGRAIRWLAVVAGVAVGACNSGPKPSHPLAGEWTIVLSGDSVYDNKAEPATTAGRILFHPQLRPILDGPPEPPRGAIFGRAYIEFDPVDQATRAGGNVPDLNSPQHELGEEAFALVDQDRVHIEVAPLIMGFDPVLRGRLSEDRVVGHWVLMSHSDTLRVGRFEMIRQARSVLTDSVLRKKRNR